MQSTMQMRPRAVRSQKRTYVREGLPISHGQKAPFKSVDYQAHAAPAFEPDEVGLILKKLRATEPWSKASAFAFAFRIGTSDSDQEGDGGAADELDEVTEVAPGEARVGRGHGEGARQA